MASTPDYYAALNISPSATPAQIRTAYKRVALKTHPDRVSHNDPTRAARTRQFQLVNDAYYVLSDPVRRADYDATRSFSPHVDTNRQFGDIFEEMMREEGLGEAEAAAAGEGAGGEGSVWSLLGGVSGATIGFIVGNVPGLLAGAVAGNRLGAIRDKKGKSVYQVFQELPQGDKAKVVFEFSRSFEWRR
ncbi:putative DnaJ chaperone [Sphaerosporella brunnea]|uniref:Putative DnaJ chaperone n=1 Tax=Sphaerosporella brunnea TaxID=1250544 RepID=A0A5J5EQS2_9PEZI|nr:putative DnaJ chaperone [Sphaerosporella brunnea]